MKSGSGSDVYKALLSGRGILSKVMGWQLKSGTLK